MILRYVSLVAVSLGLGGCAVVGVAASVVEAGVDVAGSAVSGTIDIVSSGVSGAIDLATDDDDDDNDSKIDKANTAAKKILAGAKPVPSPESVDAENKPSPATKDEPVSTVWELGD